MDKSRFNGLIKGIIGENIDNGINMLQYVDDTIFLLQDDYNSAHNLKFLFCLFEQQFEFSKHVNDASKTFKYPSREEAYNKLKAFVEV